MEDRRKRSRSYPGYTLEECIRWAATVRSDMGSGPHDRESIAKVLGSTGLTGASTRKIGAMVHFGLLKRESEGYSLSLLSERILRPVKDAERARGLTEAFMHADLYSELLQRFKSDNRVPARLPNILVRDHGIEDSAAQDAAKVFLASGRFAGILDDDGRITVPAIAEYDEAVYTQSPRTLKDESLTYTPLIEDQHQVPDTAALQQFRFALTMNRIATLTVPLELSAADILLIQKQIELLSLQAELAHDRR